MTLELATVIVLILNAAAWVAFAAALRRATDLFVRENRRHRRKLEEGLGEVLHDYLCDACSAEEEDDDDDTEDGEAWKNA